MVKPKSDPFDLEAAIRNAIEASGRTFYDLARETSVDASQISRFYRGERTVTLETASTLCKALRMTLKPVPLPPGVEKTNRLC